MLSDVKELLELIGILKGWMDQVSQERKAKSEQQAAKLLGTAGILVASLRTLDNSFRGVMADLLLFDAGWDDKRRETARDRINQFAQQEKILPHVRQSLHVLTKTSQDDLGPDQQAVQTLVNCANRILNAIRPDVTPFPSHNILVRFLDDIKDARTGVEAEMVRSAARRHLSVLERRILAEADIGFAELKQGILARHPALPDPGWAVAL